MFDLDKFIEECVQARKESESQKAICEVVAANVTQKTDIIKAIGEPTGAGFEALYQSDDLTILNFTWAPLMSLMPHNHNAWAVIGIYDGREDNIFWKKTGNRIEAAGAKSLMPGTAAMLGKDIIHSVVNPTEKITSAIHVYGGNFFAPGRSEWDPETLEEGKFDFDKSRKIFREANERFSLSQKN